VMSKLSDAEKLVGSKFLSRDAACLISAKQPSRIGRHPSRLLLSVLGGVAAPPVSIRAGTRAKPRVILLSLAIPPTLEKSWSAPIYKLQVRAR
jgi:hypothetical protein